MKLQVNTFSSNADRLPFAFANADQLASLRNPDIKYVVFTTEELKPKWQEKLDCLKKDLDCHIDTQAGGHYLGRSMIAASTTAPYSSRVDDDLFIPRQAWKYMFDNLYALDNPQVSWITPEISTAIPQVEYFIEDFFNEEQKKHIGVLLKQAKVPRYPWMPTEDYQSLIDVIDAMPEWDGKKWMDAVMRHPSIYKSIHPIRFDRASTDYMTDVILDNWNKLFASNFEIKGGYTKQFEIHEVCYHTSHPTLFRTDFYRRALGRLMDGFDETAFNQLALTNYMSSYIVRNAFSIHMCMNYVANKEEVEARYIDAVRNRL